MDYQAAIDIRGLCREFSMRKDGGVTRVLAVDGLNLTIESGELFGLLGVNGAGKTTTIKMLATLLEPTAGDASICGLSVRRAPNRVRSVIGCQLPGERTLYWKLTARENMEFFGAMYGLSPRAAKNKAMEVLSLVGLSDRADERIEKYSTGMRQRAALARTLLHSPRVIFLDEPTSGLDVHSARSLRTLVRALADSGLTVLLTTHNLAEAEELCDRIGVIHGGRLVALDTPAGLRRISQNAETVSFNVKLRSPHAFDATIVTDCLTEVFGLSTARGVDSLHVAVACSDSEDDVWTIEVQGRDLSEHLAEAVVALHDSGMDVTKFESRRPTLEDVFVELTRAVPSEAGGGHAC